MTDRTDMEAVVEAILFVSNDPVARDKLLDVFGAAEREEAGAALDAVIARYREKPSSGLVVDEVAGGLRLVSRPDLHGYLRRFFEVTGSNKLSMAALETLAIVAYRQPVTGPEITELRGVGSQGVLKTLLERRLVRVAGRKEVVGKPFLYATTREFLMHFGLRSLRELPPLEQFEELFAGDPEASGNGDEADVEEIADREAAEIEEQEEDARRLEAESLDAQDREENELLELPVDAAAPVSPPAEGQSREQDEASPPDESPESKSAEREDEGEDKAEDAEEPPPSSTEESSLEAGAESDNDEFRDEMSAAQTASEDEGKS